MATFKFGRTVNIHWYGNEIVGPADTVFSIPDQLYNEFESEFRPIEPSLTWINTNEGQASTIIGTSPVSVLTAGTTSTISFSSSTNPSGYLLAADGSGGLIYVPASTIGINSVVGISPISSAISGGIASVSIDTTALTGLSAETLQTRVKNSSGSTISKGQVVYVTGSDGTNALIGLATASTEAGSSKVLGIAASTMTNNAFGYVIENGQLSNIDTSSATAGSSVWLGNTLGSYVFDSPPAEPSNSVYLGVVTKANVSTGEVLVKVQNGYELDELHDVSAENPSDLDIIQYKSSSSMWTKASISNAGIAASTHTHEYISSVIGTSPLSVSTSSGTATISIPSAGTATVGAVQLTDSISSTSITTAATPNSVKSAYDLANTAVQADPFAAFMFGDSSVIGNVPRWTLTTSNAGTDSRIFHTRFIPHKNFTVSNISMTGNATASSGAVTLIRFGIYTRSGTTFTLVARTANDTTIFSTANTKYTRALDTTGGYPATYDMTAGTEYWVSVIQVGGTIAGRLGTSLRLSTAANNATGVQMYFQNSQSDLVASSTGTLFADTSAFYVEVS